MSTRNDNIESKNELFRNNQSAWLKEYSTKKDEILNFNNDYKVFLKKSKTERLCANNIIRILKKSGFQKIDKKDKISSGDRLYLVFRNKVVFALIAGKNPDKLRLIGSHIDSPRLDFKPNPVYEDAGLALLKSHYYGGIKKYQWLNTPLAIHGIVINNRDQKIEISFGDQDDQPKFIIPDLLIHLSKEQMKKSANKMVAGEDLNIIAGNIPVKNKEVKKQVKYALLKYLYDNFNMTEEDFNFAELEFVPAADPVDIGFRKGLLAAYGQDDRVCAYTSLRAITEIEKPGDTALAFFCDKEEIGSTGDTGSGSFLLSNFTTKYIQKTGLEIDNSNLLQNALSISADVTAGWNPNFKEVQDQYNTNLLGHGVAIQKYHSGSPGKGNTNDAHAEYIAYLRKIIKNNTIPWQMGEMGKIDLANSGTISKFMSKYGMNCIDIGPPVLGMHSPMEVTSKADVYAAYELYKAFYKDAGQPEF